MNETGGDYMEPIEIIFEVTEAAEGGFDATLTMNLCPEQ